MYGSFGRETNGSGGRDLGKARAAYHEMNAQASREAHASGNSRAGAEEGHRKHGDLIKSIVYGGMDGILTSFAIISGAAGGGLGTEVVLVLGLSNIVADAFSMGVGDTVSTLAYYEHVYSERRRECWEFDNYPRGEIEQMIDLYEARGLPREKAATVCRTMAKYRDFFIDVKMVEDLRLMVPSQDDNPYKEGCVTFLSFLIFGMLPLLCYIIFPLKFPDMSTEIMFAIAFALTMIVLFTLGAFKSMFSSMTWYRSGFEFMLLGSFAAATSYLIGLVVDYLARDFFGQHTPLPGDELP